MHDVVVEGARVGIGASGPMAVLAFEDLLVLDPELNAINVELGASVSIEGGEVRGAGGSYTLFVAGDGARLELSHVVLDANGWAGLGLNEGSFRAIDVVVKDPAFVPQMRQGEQLALALQILDNSDVYLERVYVANYPDGMPIGRGSHVTMIDTTLRGLGYSHPTVPYSTHAMFVSEGTVVAGERVAIEDSRAQVLAFFGPDAQVTMTDFRLHRAAGEPGGNGLIIEHGADVALQRVSIEDGTRLGYQSMGDSVVEMSDLSISGYPTGMELIETSSVTVTRGRVQDADGAGVCMDHDTTMSAREFTVRGVSGRAVSEERCPVLQFGVGIVVAGRSRLSLEQFALEDIRGTGLLILGLDSVSASDGQISRDDIGVRTSIDYALTEHLHRLRFEANGIDIDVD
jgi:hypothetical protein